MWHIKSKNEKKCELDTVTSTVSRVRGLWFGAKLGPVQSYSSSWSTMVRKHQPFVAGPN